MDALTPARLTHVDQFLRSFTSPNTREAYSRDLRGYAAFSEGMDPLSFGTVVLYRDSLSASYAPATVVRKVAAVKSFMSFLASEGLIASSPAQNVRVPRASAVEPTEAFDDAEVARVLAQPDVSEFAGSTHRLALALLFSLGLRRSELVALRAGSVRLHRGQRFLTVDGKGGKQRLIPLTEHVSKEVDMYQNRYKAFTGRELRPEDFLLQSSPLRSNDRPVSPATVYRMVVQHARAAGVTRRVSPHSCRATVISHLLEKGVSPRDVADLAGHSSIQTTVGTYDRKRDALSTRTVDQVNYLDTAAPGGQPKQEDTL